MSVERALRILHLEDDPADADLIRITLAKDGLALQCQRVVTREDFKAALTNGRFDIILSDYGLPQFDGMGALDLAHQLRPDTPFIFVSGTIGEERAIDALKAGATDYVLKDHLARLPAAIHRALAEFEERAKRRRLEERLHLLLTITRAISEAVDLDGALAVALRRICEATGWKLGQVWIPRADGLLLECSGAWYAATERFGPFHATSQGLTIAPKQSLVGRVWATGQSDWESNLADARRFLRSSAALEVGLKTGVAIPVLAEHRTVAVMEFFDTDEQRDDQGLVSVISLISGVAAQLGAVILRKRAEEGIKASLRIKEDLLREVHHRVKNNMQVISSLLNLQAGSIENPIVQILFRESQARIQAMAFVHEKLYGSHDLAKADFVEYLQSLAAHLFRLYGVDRTKVTLEINAGNVFLSLDTAMPCGLIVNELVSNALKHGFPGNRRGSVIISVTTGETPGEFTLIVRDTGVGFPKEVDFRETPGSLGIRLVLTLVNQLGGRLDLDRSSGTTVTIRFREQVPPQAAVSPPQQSHAA